MKALFQKLFQSKLIVAGVLLLVLVGGGMVAVDKLSGDDDSDADGIADSVDMCPGTIVDKPSGDWGANRYLWIGGEFFTVLDPATGGDKNKVFSEYSMPQTKGCSCVDIVKTNTKGGNIENDTNYKNGCTKGTLDGWIRKVNG